MTKTVGPNDDYLNEIIRLQLKKPKKWNWELTTSRSSPHISLPVIQLYNAKGKLLVEAKESGSERRSWHSNDWAINNRSRTVLSNDHDPRSLQKCTSDILYRRRYDNNPLTGYDAKKVNGTDLDKGRSSFGAAPIGDKSIVRDGLRREHSLRYRKMPPFTGLDFENEDKYNRYFNKYYKSKSANLLEKDQKSKPATRLDLEHDPRKDIRIYVKSKNCTNLEGFPKSKSPLRINEEILSKNKLNFPTISSGKPKSAIRQTRSGSLNLSSDKLKTGDEKPIKKSRSVLIRFSEDTKDDGQLQQPSESKLLHGYKRSKSDDLYKRLLKYNDESIKRAINDGYKKFLNVDLHERPNNNNSSNAKVEKMKREIVQANPELKPEVNRVKYSKYITRTCSAGTLVIKEESFSNPNMRRRRKTADSERRDSTKVPNFNSLRRRELYPNRKDDISYPHMLTRVKGDRPSFERTDSLKLPAYNNLYHSKSDVSPFTGGDRLFHSPTISNNYTVEEPSSLESRKNSEDIGVEGERRPTRRTKKVRGRSVEDSASFSSGASTDDVSRKGNSVKARVVKEHKKDAISDAELLRLVRGLSNDHAKMGANVSRHSSKGLSGRRTQSSGSICNGKGGSGGGRHTNSEPKICGSLPSYLDERDASTGCNNNHHHECEKPPLQDVSVRYYVERIPPLGDGAPLHWKFSDTQTALCDQGYGSERSPEEEYPPPLPEHDNQCHHHLDLHSCYPFITPESTFTVSLAKGSRGLGLSVTGGVDSGGSWPGLIRVKRLFPHQPAASCEMLNVGDLILEVNGITLTGLTNYEALEVLRTASNQVELKICRPPPDVLSCVSPISEVPPPPPRREPPSSLNLTSVSDDEHCLGEFEVTMRKLQGSLGFTLRKEDDSALGHYIRALVREPALTDSRIRAGDKIIAVNDVEISSMTHEEAVQFLRQSGEIVKLRLYRDLAQTPVATLSPTETTPRTSFSKKTQLRQEAMDMLNDIAVRKLIPGNQDIYGRRSQSPNTSPRRLRRQPCPSDASHISDTSSKHLITDEQFHEGLLKKCSLPLDEDSFNSLFIEDDDCDRPSRPSSLDLYNPNQTPVACRKPKFNFSLAHNAYELNNLDAEILDAPNLTYNLGSEDANSTEVECGDSFPQEPASMPHIPTDNPGFSYKNPAYQSAHPQCGTENGDEKTPKSVADDSNMKKWKGVVFTTDEERERERQRSIKTPKKEEEDKYEILAIELNRGWNSRLGFSLQGAAGVTYVSAVHADSVAARDGRIKPGDCLIKVNDESVEHMTTSEIIDLLRIVRGPVCIVVSRPKSKEDCPTKSNAAN